MKCPYCSASSQGRCATAGGGRSITECTSCGRVVEERHHFPHHLFRLRSQDNPLCLVTSDLPSLPQALALADADADPFESTGFITAFSTWSLEHSPLSLRSCLSFSGHLAELERTLESTNPSSSSSSSSTSSGATPSSSSTVVVDNLRAYMQIIDVASILGLDCDISDHAFQLFRDCCSATCLRNRSVEALATAALVQAIREAQEPRTLQEISIAANVPQKEIGKYIKILGEALQLSQPINSNSISVHMPRFCTLLQLNKSAQELATHIGEVVINKCFCTRRNPISISAAAIYLACQLEDKRKTQAEICKVTGLTEVTLRKVYKELLENWDDLLPSNYTPAVPPEKAFPTTAITSGRTSAKAETAEVIVLDKDSQVEAKPSKDKKADNKSNKFNEVPDMNQRARSKEESECKGNSTGADTHLSNHMQTFSYPWLSFGPSGVGLAGEKSQSGVTAVDIKEALPKHQRPENKEDKEKKVTFGSIKPNPISSSSATASSVAWPFFASSTKSSLSSQFVESLRGLPDDVEMKEVEIQNKHRNA
ncbi:plant-specific TFIIB-related protein 1 [Eucalyptus grandis]|uniref:plant-specific TFIIB-related protein 1 n=1 Tax=Eucalyptus grandis TaxID=71139 RepID=UPI00192EEA5B|nr:plant-specific TFIIB-related protein 1 [Eucalyptus grandis]XP_010070050.2 plant-specific TFIIB-related protein 1 [Eucalyptus grandis]XP_018716762.2 plant-specific TFIIB-related protein 1 [Eucalyptus grandis]